MDKINRLISVVTPCYNEEENVEEIYRQVKSIFNGLEKYDYEHIFIDNSSTDSTVAKLKMIATEDRSVKIIVNTRNFGYIRSPYYGLLQAHGSAVILIAADMQDPPSLIGSFLEKWEQGFKIVIAVKNQSEESLAMFQIRKIYYYIINKLADIELIKNFTGFGLYDEKVISILREINDPYPYLRGLICDIGFEKAIINFVQPVRKRGISASNFYTLFDLAITGVTNHSKVPLRLATITGCSAAIFGFVIAIGYLIYKLLFWHSFSLGMAPLVIGLFFFSSVQLFFIGIIGEYIGSMHTQVLKRPLVIEKERVNF